MKLQRFSKTTLSRILLSSMFMVIMLSCTDSLMLDNKITIPNSDIGNTNFQLLPNLAPPDPFSDSIETVTVLGIHLPNPFLLENIKKAYKNIRGNSTGIGITHLYVRFQPTSINQLVTLAETLDLDITDIPMDYQVIQQGDYYQDPSIPDNQITYQYVVVPPSFSFPIGIPYTILASIHIPTDTNIEAEAERLAGLNSDGDDIIPGGGGDLNYTVAPMLIQCAAGYHWDSSIGKCVSDRCDIGQHYDASLGKCVADYTPPPPRIATCRYNNSLGYAA